MVNIERSFPNDNIAVTFSNEKGIILDSRGKKKLLNRFQKDHYIPGADWSERAFGTNGIGTCLESGKQVQVFAAEHYCEIAHDMICSSAPVRETVSGVILGVLTITAQKDVIPALNLNWAISEAQKIEKALQGRLQEEFSYLSHFLYMDFYRGLIAGNMPRRCHSCGRYFLLNKGYDTCYCNNVAPGETGKTCRKVGAHKKEARKEGKTPARLEYDKVYNRLKTRRARGKLSADEWNDAVALALEYKDKAEAGKISDSELKEIYDKI